MAVFSVILASLTMMEMLVVSEELTVVCISKYLAVFSIIICSTCIPPYSVQGQRDLDVIASQSQGTSRQISIWIHNVIE